MGEAARRRGEFDVLTGFRGHRLDLGEAVGEQIGLAAQLADATAPLVQRLRSGAPGVEGVGGLVEVEACETVERGALLGRTGQAQLVGLTVYGEQPLGELTEHRDRGRRTTDVGTGASGGADGAAQDEARAVVELAA